MLGFNEKNGKLKDKLEEMVSRRYERETLLKANKQQNLDHKDTLQQEKIQESRILAENENKHIEFERLKKGWSNIE